MVAGKVKAAMGFQRSPATPKSGENPRRSNCSPRSNKSVCGVAPPPPPLSSGASTVFSRSFGVYFPRSSAQIQPHPRPPPDVADLLRVVEELQERESRLRSELLEHKILKETVAIVPFLEQEVAAKEEELGRSKQSVERLQAENQTLHLELEAFRARIPTQEEERMMKDKRIQELEAEVDELRRSSRRICVDADECSSSQRFQSFIDAASRSNLLKNFKKAQKSTDVVAAEEAPKPDASDRKRDDEMEAERMLHSRSERDEILASRPRGPRVPKPPPRPSTSSDSAHSTTSSSSSSITSSSEASSITPAAQPAPPPTPPPVPPVRAGTGTGVRAAPPPPPPPPPPPAKGRRSTAASVRRVPEVVEFYHSLMRRDSKREAGGGAVDAAAAASSSRDMIGEIENRSAHLLAIKTDVGTQGDFIRFLIKEVNEAAFTHIEDLVAFVKWLDDELSYLVDERAVLKHFEWPEQKADSMREAAFGYCDLKKLESEASSLLDDPRQPCSSALKKMQALLEKLEHGLYNLSRVRESAAKRYKGFQIPWEWMQESGFVSQIKLRSVKLAMKYMKRVSSELEVIGGAPEEEELMLQGVRFAFRVHQFAGGFDAETMRAFQEFRDKALSLQRQNQNLPQPHKILIRSVPC